MDFEDDGWGDNLSDIDLDVVDVNSNDDPGTTNADLKNHENNTTSINSNNSNVNKLAGSSLPNDTDNSDAMEFQAGPVLSHLSNFFAAAAPTNISVHQDTSTSMPSESILGKGLSFALNLDLGQNDDDLDDDPNNNGWDSDDNDFGDLDSEEEEEEKNDDIKEENSSLLDGWEETIDPSTNKPYYYHEADNITTWTRPVKNDHTSGALYKNNNIESVTEEKKGFPDSDHNGDGTVAVTDHDYLPEGWTEVIDPSSQKPYYYHEVDNITTWDRPTTAPTISATGNGGYDNMFPSLETSYQNKNVVEKQQEIQSEELPYGWTEVLDPNTNKMYYYHEMDNITTWDRPMNIKEVIHSDQQNSDDTPESSEETEGWGDQDDDIDNFEFEESNTESNEDLQPNNYHDSSDKSGVVQEMPEPEPNLSNNNTLAEENDTPENVIIEENDEVCEESGWDNEDLGLDNSLPGEEADIEGNDMSEAIENELVGAEVDPIKILNEEDEEIEPEVCDEAGWDDDDLDLDDTSQNEFMNNDSVDDNVGNVVKDQAGVISDSEANVEENISYITTDDQLIKAEVDPAENLNEKGGGDDDGEERGWDDDDLDLDDTSQNEFMNNDSVDDNVGNVVKDQAGVILDSEANVEENISYNTTDDQLIKAEVDPAENLNEKGGGDDDGEERGWENDDLGLDDIIIGEDKPGNKAEKEQIETVVEGANLDVEDDIIIDLIAVEGENTSANPKNLEENEDEGTPGWDNDDLGLDDSSDEDKINDIVNDNTDNVDSIKEVKVIEEENDSKDDDLANATDDNLNEDETDIFSPSQVQTSSTNLSEEHETNETSEDCVVILEGDNTEANVPSDKFSSVLKETNEEIEIQNITNKDNIEKSSENTGGNDLISCDNHDPCLYESSTNINPSLVDDDGVNSKEREEKPDNHEVENSTEDEVNDSTKIELSTEATTINGGIVNEKDCNENDLGKDFSDTSEPGNKQTVSSKDVTTAEKTDLTEEQYNGNTGDEREQIVETVKESTYVSEEGWDNEDDNLDIDDLSLKSNDTQTDDKGVKTTEDEIEHSSLEEPEVERECSQPSITILGSTTDNDETEPGNKNLALNDTSVLDEDTETVEDEKISESNINDGGMENPTFEDNNNEESSSPEITKTVDEAGWNDDNLDLDDLSENNSYVSSTEKVKNEIIENTYDESTYVEVDNKVEVDESKNDTVGGEGWNNDEIGLDNLSVDDPQTGTDDAHLGELPHKVYQEEDKQYSERCLDNVLDDDRDINEANVHVNEAGTLSNVRDFATQSHTNETENESTSTPENDGEDNKEGWADDDLDLDLDDVENFEEKDQGNDPSIEKEVLLVLSSETEKPSASEESNKADVEEGWDDDDLDLNDFSSDQENHLIQIENEKINVDIDTEESVQREVPLSLTVDEHSTKERAIHTNTDFSQNNEVKTLREEVLALKEELEREKGNHQQVLMEKQDLTICMNESKSEIRKLVDEKEKLKNDFKTSFSARDDKIIELEKKIQDIVTSHESEMNLVREESTMKVNSAQKALDKAESELFNNLKAHTRELQQAELQIEKSNKQEKTRICELERKIIEAETLNNQLSTMNQTLNAELERMRKSFNEKSFNEKSTHIKEAETENISIRKKMSMMESRHSASVNQLQTRHAEEIKMFENERKSYIADLNDKVKCIETLEKQLDDLKIEREKEQVENVSLTNELTNKVNSFNETLQAKDYEMQTNLDDLRNKCSVLVEEKETLEADLEELLVQMGLQKEIAQQEVDEYENKLVELENELNSVIEQNQFIREQFQESEVKAQNIISEKNKKIEDIVKDHSNLQSKLGELQSHVTEKENEIDNLMAANNGLSDQTTGLKNELSLALEKNNALSEELTNREEGWEKCFQDLNNQLEEVQSKFSAQDEEKNSYVQKKLRLSQLEREKLISQCDDHMKTISDQAAIINELRKANEHDLSLKENTHKTYVTELESQLESSRQECLAYEDDLNIKSKNIEELESSLVEKQTMLENLLSSQEASLSDAEFLAKELEQKDSKIEELEASITSVKESFYSKAESEESELENFKNRVEDLQSSLLQKDNEIDSLTSKVDELECVVAQLRNYTDLPEGSGADDAESNGRMRQQIIYLANALQQSEMERAKTTERFAEERSSSAEAMKRLRESVKRYYSSMS